MTNQRKYFKYSIVQLEGLFEESKNNIGTLEELEEELEHRKTKRAKKLFIEVQSILKAKIEKNPIRNESENPVIPIPNNENPDNSEPQVGDDIDWEAVINDTPVDFPDSTEVIDQVYTNKPLNILESWTAIEAFSPQTYKHPRDLQGNGSIAYFKDSEPWLRGEKSRPSCNLYYIIYLGSIELEKSSEKLIAVYQDKRIERPTIRGKAALGAILVNKQGIPVLETGIALSSFGWAYGQAIDGHLNRIKNWEEAEKKLLEEVDKFVYRQDENGQDIPLSFLQIQHIYQWLVHVCKIPKEDVAAPSFAVRLYQPFSKGEPETPLLNSFYLSDLQWASFIVKKESTNKALSQYLGITRPSQKIDILRNKSYLEDALKPQHTPLGRWPNRGRFPLVLLQQTAVNLCQRELKKEGLFSVNGPPGTGKTTLLRDIVAHNVVERAVALSTFDEVDDAFSHAGKMKIGKGFTHFYQLSDKIRGFEMLVASSNNKAVENISKELPLATQISDDLTGFSYFKTVSDALSEDDETTWGMIAAVLGNAKNRSNFASKVWWDEQSGLQNYFKAITGQISRDPDDYDDGVVPLVIEECEAPLDTNEAKYKWKTALKKFRQNLLKAQKINALAQKAYESQKCIHSYEEKLATIALNISRQIIFVKQLKQKLQLAKQKCADIEAEVNSTNKNLELFSNTRPGIIGRLFFRAKWHLWCQQNQKLQELSNAKNQAFDNANEQYSQSEATYKKNTLELDRLKNEKTRLEEEYRQAVRNVQTATDICGDLLVTPELWDLPHEEQHKFTPTFVKRAHHVRDDLFVSAIQLHKAFIDAASKQIRQNLSIFFFLLSNGKIPQDKRSLIPHLWSTAFLFTPVVSTTFASVGRMLNGMPSESIGWLLIDEAGQAIPQAAVGAILRAKRTIAVGDPLQIEPVVTLPLPLLESIFKHYKVDPYLWGAPYTSVQTLSDEANPFGTSISRDLEEIRIGVPLLVHRRCENPMFNISNQLAYNRQMVFSTQVKESVLTVVLGQSRWFHITGSAQEKWCPEEGEFVVKMILDAAKVLRENLDLFVITPFTIVAQSMRSRMEKEKESLRHYGIENPSSWIIDNIGTVHTFQGKEAQGVILLLGAPSPSQNGARNWATTKVNLLNVAVSRAKQNFYVVGNRQLWGEMGNMKVVSRYLN